MPVNKVIYDGNTLIDLSGDTVSPDKLMEGVTAHDKTGAQIVGTATGGGGATEPYVEETYDSNGNLINAVMHGSIQIRPHMFYSCKKLTSISLPDGITKISEYAFNDCYQLNLKCLPEGITSIEQNGLSNCQSMSLTSLPESLTYIGKFAFNTCRKLTLTSLPAGIVNIGDYAFTVCVGLFSITFEGTPTTIASSAFKGCTNLTTINVPWAEGAVADAPWGATNATINYNYTEGGVTL